MTVQVSATIRDDQRAFIDDNPKYSLSGLLQQAIDAEMDTGANAAAAETAQD